MLSFLPQTTSDFLVSCSVYTSCKCTVCVYMYITCTYIVRDGSSLYLKHVVTYSMYSYIRSMNKGEKRKTTQKQDAYDMYQRYIIAYKIKGHMYMCMWSSDWGTLPWFVWFTCERVTENVLCVLSILCTENHSQEASQWLCNAPPLNLCCRQLICLWTDLFFL